MVDRENDAFILERYKYILQQIHALNQSVPSYLTLFQTLTTAIIGAGVAVFVSWQGLNISAELAVVGIRGLLGLLTILALFVVTSLIAGLFSWFDYRNEEVDLLSEVGLSELRSRPRVRNFWRWYEFYLILFIVVVVAVVWIFAEGWALPLIRSH